MGGLFYNFYDIFLWYYLIFIFCTITLIKDFYIYIFNFSNSANRRLICPNIPLKNKNGHVKYERKSKRKINKHSLLNFRILFPTLTGLLSEFDFNYSLTENNLLIKNSSKWATYGLQCITTLVQVNRTRQTRGQFKSSCPISFHSQVFMSKQSWKRS